MFWRVNSSHNSHTCTNMHNTQYTKHMPTTVDYKVHVCKSEICQVDIGMSGTAGVCVSVCLTSH